MLNIILSIIFAIGLDSTDRSEKSKTVFLANPHNNHLNYKSGAFKTAPSSKLKELNMTSKKTTSNRNYKQVGENKQEVVVVVGNFADEKNNLKNRNYKAK